MKKILFIICMMLLLPLQVDAANKINIKCDNNDLKIGETTECTITGKTDFEVAGLSVRLKPSKSIEIKNLITSSIWEGDGSDNFIALYTDTNKKGEFEIATFEIKKLSNDEAYLDLSEIIFVDKDFEEKNIEDTRMYISRATFDIKILLIPLTLLLFVVLILFRLKRKK